MHHASIDRYASLESPVHRLDARAKLVAVLVCTAAAVSEPRHEVAGLLPYLVPPAALILASGVPVSFILKRLLVISPFALSVAALNPIFETWPVRVGLGPWETTVRAGWVTGGSILLKFLVSALALLLLATTTRLSRLAGAMSSLGVPRALAMQVALLYRFVFLVVDEFGRAHRAASARAVGSKGLAPAAAAALAGLFARALRRAERVTQAMTARGFDGSFAGASAARLRAADVLFVAAALALSAGLRLRGLWLEG